MPLKNVHQKPGFKGKVAIFGHSLGGIISYDILANQPESIHSKSSSSRKSRSRPSHHGIVYPKLDFTPAFLFAIGSPIAAVLIMRGQDYSNYCVPPTTRFFNIFHLYDPMSYRMEPLLGDQFAEIPPVLLERPSSKSGAFFPLAYYRQQFTSYMASTSFSAQLPVLPSIGLPSLPAFPLPSLPDLSIAKETLNRQFTTMIDSITTVSSIFSESPPGRKPLKRKREEGEDEKEKELATGKSNSNKYRVIKQPVSQLHLDHPHEQPVSPESLQPPANETVADDKKSIPMERGRSTPLQSLILAGTYASVFSDSIQGSMTAVFDRLLTPVIKKMKGSAAVEPSNESQEPAESNSTPLPELHERIDFFVQETLIDNTVHQVCIDDFLHGMHTLICSI